MERLYCNNRFYKVIELAKNGIVILHDDKLPSFPDVWKINSLFVSVGKRVITISLSAQ